MRRLPPSIRPPPPPPAKGPRRPKHVEEKARLTKTGLSEDEMNAERIEAPNEHNTAEREETAFKHAEALGWSPDSHAEAKEKKADKEEALAETQRDQEGDQKGREVKQPFKTITESKKSSDQDKPQLQQTKKDEFQKRGTQENQANLQAMKLANKSHLADIGSTRLGASEHVSAVKTTDAVNEAAERALKSGKPPDAFTLLNQAQPHGVFFKEDYEREGHSEEQEDPELRAAVEECIRMLFGVRGILRVGSGRNQADESVVVIVVGQGFGETSMRSIPQKVHKYATLLALPFDVLPLKKER